jgi:hypothetical protein
MKIQISLRIVLYEKVVEDKWTKQAIHTNPRFKKTVSMDISRENLKDIIAGTITVEIGTSFHNVSFSYRDWDKKGGILSGKAVMREVACRAYTKDLHRAGWKKIRQTSKTT